MLNFNTIDECREIIIDKNQNPYLLLLNKDKTRANDIELNLYPLKIKSKDDIKIDKNSCGYALISHLDNKTASTMYEVRKEYQGAGLGNKLVERSKEIAKKIGYKKIKIDKLARYIDPVLKQDDANLILYLAHNFAIDNETISKKGVGINQESLPMVCDLEKESKMTNDEYILSILNNRKEAYIDKHLR